MINALKQMTQFQIHSFFSVLSAVVSGLFPFGGRNDRAGIWPLAASGVIAHDRRGCAAVPI